MRIAIIGGGISGMVSGYKLHRDHDVTLFEANSYIGGHTDTHDVTLEGREYAVDTGFIVFNDRTYPNFIGLLDELRVDSQPTQMSFSVSCERTGLEYRGADLGGLFAQRRNFFNLKFYRLLWDLLRFNRLGNELLNSESESESVQQFLDRHGFSKSFIEQYFFPMGASIWSAPFETFSQFPIRFIAEFYKNHGLLGVTDRPQWRVIKGGSKSYIAPLTRHWKDRIRLNSPVTRVLRNPRNVTVELGDQQETFDHVIFACHSDQAMQVLGDDITATEAEILGEFPYQPNTAVLHTQQSLLPKNRRAWACWNYFNPTNRTQSATVTYNMNMLQSIDSKHVFCVTLNDDGRIDPANVIGTFQYSHPIFGLKRKAMQDRHNELINQYQTSFCVAYWGNGFDEVLVNSALAVGQALASSETDTTEATEAAV